ncbi:PREDICTED: carbohydrate sulfotransferase 11 [Papilio polytes]|uniref:carbohydrate sulfotransferase 11 n=1 Tax=Papilio polytes TaxID=76194 RepID=UPI000675EDD7|nr:PREDICTED: carbohydrate sulfotransferase 11 [Papilio polytes]
MCVLWRKMHSWNGNFMLFLGVFFCVSGNENESTNEHSLELTQSLNLARQELIQEACRRFPLNLSLDDLPPNQLEHILVDDEHKLLYCYVPKVACTNWKRILMILASKWNGTDVLAIPASLAHSPGMFRNLSTVPKEDRQIMLDNYNKMIIVRNPFERLLSAYRNKLEGDTQSAKYFQDRVGKRIIRAYRENPSNESLAQGHDVTFKEFVLFLTNQSEEMADVVNNEHWQPITSLCHPCLIKYTLVGKYETLLDDSLLALNTINASYIQFPRLAHTSGTAEKLHKYFSQLDLPLIRRLYKLYKYDYRVFNYDLDNIVGYDLG